MLDPSLDAGALSGPGRQPGLRHFWPFAVDIGPGAIEGLLQLLTGAWPGVRADLIQGTEEGAAGDTPWQTVLACFCLRLLQANCRAALQGSGRAVQPVLEPVRRLHAFLRTVVDDAELEVGRRSVAVVRVCCMCFPSAAANQITCEHTHTPRQKAMSQSCKVQPPIHPPVDRDHYFRKRRRRQKANFVHGSLLQKCP